MHTGSENRHSSLAAEGIKLFGIKCRHLQAQHLALCRATGAAGQPEPPQREGAMPTEESRGRSWTWKQTQGRLGAHKSYTDTLVAADIEG